MLPIKLTGLDHYSITVKNISVSIEFYQNILGLEIIPRPSFDFNGAWLDCGNGVQIHLIEATAEAIVLSGSRSLHFAFATPDIFAFRTQIIEKNVEIVKDVKSRPDGILQLFIKDPDGYFIEITQSGKEFE